MTTPGSPSSSPAVREALAHLAAGHGLDEGQARAAFDEIMAGQASAAAIAGLLMALRGKGESAEEIAGAVRALRAAMRTVHHARPELLVDTCGTGGGTVTTLNISTAAAFVAAGAGAAVAKHGNRSFTSRSGSADVLESLGIAIEIEPERAARILAGAGVVFLYAPTYHPAMRHVGPVRRELGVPTLMNLVGPLANPARVERQVVGVADPVRGPRIAAALARLGSRHAMVVHAAIGMDEIAPVGPTTVWEVLDGGVREWQLDPDTLGLAASTLDGLEGGTPEQNAERIQSLFERPRLAPAALRAAILLNAAAAIHIAGIGVTMRDAVEAATAALDEGKAGERLDALRRAAPK